MSLRPAAARGLPGPDREEAQAAARVRPAAGVVGAGRAAPFRHSFARLRLHPEAGETAQERQAESVAEAATAAPAHRPADGRALPPAGEVAAASPDSVVTRALRSPAQALDDDTRRFFEPRFGFDFGGILVHAGREAAAAARALDAAAFAFGRHIVFDAGAYRPASPDGRHLLAHELAHSGQQSPVRLPGTLGAALTRSAPRVARQRHKRRAPPDPMAAVATRVEGLLAAGSEDFDAAFKVLLPLAIADLQNVLRRLDHVADGRNLLDLLLAHADEAGAAGTGAHRLLLAMRVARTARTGLALADTRELSIESGRDFLNWAPSDVSAQEGEALVSSVAAGARQPGKRTPRDVAGVARLIRAGDMAGALAAFASPASFAALLDQLDALGRLDIRYLDRLLIEVPGTASNTVLRKALIYARFGDAAAYQIKSESLTLTPAEQTAADAWVARRHPVDKSTGLFSHAAAQYANEARALLVSKGPDDALRYLNGLNAEDMAGALTELERSGTENIRRLAAALPALQGLGDKRRLTDAIRVVEHGLPAGTLTPDMAEFEPFGTIQLGTLSARFESGDDPAVVSSGAGDPGGQSYGLFQLIGANAGRFVARFYPTDFAGLQPATPAFNAKWRAVAARNPVDFSRKQRAFIKETHYDPVVADVNAGSSGLFTHAIDVNARSLALRRVVWSTAVQHGPGSAPMILAAISAAQAALPPADRDNVTDEAIINAIYNERGRTTATGNLAHFGGASPAVQRGVASRFVQERSSAVKDFRREQSY